MRYLGLILGLPIVLKIHSRRFVCEEMSSRDAGEAMRVCMAA